MGVDFLMNKAVLLYQLNKDKKFNFRNMVKVRTRVLFPKNAKGYTIWGMRCRLHCNRPCDPSPLRKSDI